MSEHRSFKRGIVKCGTAIVAVLLAANLGLSARANAADPVTPAANPTLNPATCGASLDIALVVDLSSSMTGAPLASLQDASTSFVDSLTGTNTQIAIFTFSANSPSNSTNDANHPLTSIQTTDGANQVESWINGWTTVQGTQWSAGLNQVAQSDTTFDMVIFITDGAPKDTEAQYTTAANSVKEKGTRIIGFAVGPDADTTFMPDISGPLTNQAVVADNDYFLGTWDNFKSLLSGMTTVCPQQEPVSAQQLSVPVQYVDDDNGDAVVTAPGTTTLTGLAGDPVNYTVAQAQAGVPAGYNYVSLDNVTTFSSDPSVNQTITVHLTQQQAAPPAATVPNTPQTASNTSQTVSVYTGGTAVHVSPATALAAGAGAVALLAGLVAIGYLRRVRN